MIKFVIAAAAAALALPAAAVAHAPNTQAQLLPDFPPNAQPGECWARAPLGAAPAPQAGQSVWTLKRGHGPEAVWGYSERANPGGPAAAARAAGGYQWTRVECDGSRPAYGGLAHAAPAAPMTHSAPPPYAGMQAGPAPRPHMGMQAHGPMPQGHPPVGFEHHQRGVQHHGYAGAMAPRPPHGPPDMPPPPPMFGHPMPMAPFAGPPMPPPPGFAPPPYPQAMAQPSAPWFGGRFLTWPGKSPR